MGRGQDLFLIPMHQGAGGFSPLVPHPLVLPHEPSAGSVNWRRRSPQGPRFFPPAPASRKGALLWHVGVCGGGQGPRGGEVVAKGKGGRRFAIPPLLQRWAEALGKERDHRTGGPCAGVKQFDRIGRTAACRQIRHEATADASPAGLLAPPGQTATGPGQLFPVEKAAAGAEHPVAELATGAGLQAAMGEHRVNLLHLSPKKSHPQGWLSGRPAGERLSTALPRRGF